MRGACVGGQGACRRGPPLSVPWLKSFLSAHAHPASAGHLRYSPDAMAETLILVAVFLVAAGAALIVWSNTRTNRLRAEPGRSASRN